MSKKTMTRRTFLKQTLMTGSAVFVAAAGGCRAKEIPAWFEVSEWDVKVPRLPGGFEGFRILHLTDIHHSEWMDEKRLGELRAFVLAQTDIDLILVTGDSTYHNMGFDTLIEFYSGLNGEGRYPVLMSWGNHDIWDDAPVNLAPIFENGVHLLDNDVFVLEENGDHLCIAGLNCAYEELDDLGKVLERMPEEDMPALMMAHEPDVAPTVAETGKFFLQISGHSHGGQICLPGGYAPILPWLGQKYSRGLYAVKEMMLYTSRGLGRGRPFIRMNCPAEAVVYTLRAGDETAFEETISG